MLIFAFILVYVLVLAVVFDNVFVLLSLVEAMKVEPSKLCRLLVFVLALVLVLALALVLSLYYISWSCFRAFICLILDLALSWT